jgi:signal-transduction protein with cAMP-binding, CBS, and nucleotidyltransferase domain
LDRVVIEGEHLKMILNKLEEAKKSVDDLIDTFEMLQDQRFLKELKEGLDEADRGDVIRFTSLEELRKESARG